jgi:hypothetical protein
MLLVGEQKDEVLGYQLQQQRARALLPKQWQLCTRFAAFTITCG